MRSFRDFYLGAIPRQHPDRNLQTLPGWVTDTDRPVAPLGPADDLQGSATKRVKGVKDLNVRIIRTQGIVGEGAGEEIIQEVFLALFLHLRQGKPRHNLRGWIFQVAHNLGLKQRNLLQRNRQSLLEYGGTTPDNFFVDAALNPEINWRACSDECDYSVSGKRFPSRTGSAFPFGPKASPIVRSVRFWTCRWALYLFL